MEERNPTPPYLSLLGFTQATKSDRFFCHISPCWVSPKQQRAIAFSVISLPVGFHPSHKGRSLFPSYLSLLGETQATNVGFHPSHKGRSPI
ncbi:hypothetical protein [Limnospira fusiformis]|uniref:hypothetical protein n=1 Tax=Limnospira fusiformis TaxID=54297 RepID=UPI0014493F53|nr:hypothetical protein HFV01_06900 [Limnospira fusiformis SAG 85.79]